MNDQFPNIHYVANHIEAKRQFKERNPELKPTDAKFCYVSRTEAVQGLIFRPEIEYYIQFDVSQDVVQRRMELTLLQRESAK